MGGLALAFAACVGVPCVVFYVLFRHWIFVALALCPPVAVIGAAILLGRGDFDQALVAALFGIVAALILATDTFRGISDGRTPRAAASAASRFVAGSIGTVFAACAAILVADAFVLNDWRRCAMTFALLAAGFGTAFAANLACAFFPFSELAIADANAAREWRERFLDRCFPEMQTRWAFSVCGIAIVLAAVAVFGIRDANVYWPARTVPFVMLGLVSIVCGFLAVAREWRLTAALTLAAGFSAVLLLWAAARRDYYPDLFSVNAMLFLLSAPLAVLAARARQYAREGDDVASALASAIRDVGAVPGALGIITGLPGLFSTITSAALSQALVFAIASTFAMLLLFPALAVAIHTLIPRYRTVDEVFGRR